MIRPCAGLEPHAPPLATRSPAPEKIARSRRKWLFNLIRTF